MTPTERSLKLIELAGEGKAIQHGDKRLSDSEGGTLNCTVAYGVIDLITTNYDKLKPSERSSLEINKFLARICIYYCLRSEFSIKIDPITVGDLPYSFLGPAYVCAFFHKLDVRLKMFVKAEIILSRVFNIQTIHDEGRKNAEVVRVS